MDHGSWARVSHEEPPLHTQCLVIPEPTQRRTTAQTQRRCSGNLPPCPTLFSLQTFQVSIAERQWAMRDNHLEAACENKREARPLQHYRPTEAKRRPAEGQRSVSACFLHCPLAVSSAALESMRFHPGAGSLGAQAACWLNTGFSICLCSNSSHSLSDTNTVINLFKPQVAGLLSTKWG